MPARSDPDLRDLRYFLVCCEEGQLTAAARRLHVAQPTLSHALARLESAVGSRLLERPANRRAGLRPTPAGAALRSRARRIAGELSALADDLAALEGVLRGDLRIGSIQSINASLLPGPLARFAKAHPGVALTLRTLASGEVPAAVRDGRVDLGLMAGPLAEPVGVTTTRVGREDFVAIVRRDDPLLVEAAKSDAGCVPLRRLAGRPLVLVPADTITGSVIHQAFRRAGCTPQVVLALDSGEALRETVREGLGATILPEGYLPAHDLDLRAVRLSDPTPRRDLLAVTRQGTDPSAALSAFLGGLRTPLFQR